MNDNSHCTVIPIASGGFLRVEALAPHALRVRMRTTNDFPESALERYGIIRCRPNADMVAYDDGSRIALRTAEAELRVDAANGTFVLLRASGELLTRHAAPSRYEAGQGFAVHFTLADGERWYGFGDETRERIEHRGHRTSMWVENVKRYAPVPFLMSSRGWGLAINTTWKHEIDIGCTQPDRLTFEGANGELDYFVFVGDSPKQLLDRYTNVAGKPALLPRWAYGLTYVCHELVNAREMMDDALNFRREGIPCDMIGLEPGWMEKPNDWSTSKNWHPERFRVPPFSNESETFIGALDKLGFKLSLLLSCVHDLSVYEEQQLAGSTPHSTALTPETEYEEPWYEHLRKFVDQGVAAFKLSGSWQSIPQPGRRWSNGMDDEEMHNLYPLLLAKQMHVGFREQTGLRPMIYTLSGFTGMQQYAATWAGSSGKGAALVSMLNHGMSGHVHTTADMDVSTPETIHFGFLQPWSQINSWAYWRHPCLLEHDLLQTFKAYAKLRYRLLPYIYSAAHEAARTGMPIIRAMPLAFPDDPRADGLLNQYMLGEFFLVAAFTETVYLPEGEWIDYWTGIRQTGPAELDYNAPAPAGGPLFVRAGAIFPTWPEVTHIGTKQPETIGLHLYPYGVSNYTLIEDDGTTYGYLEGNVAETSVNCRATEKWMRIVVGRRTGRYEGMPAKRRYEMFLHVTAKPLQVAVDGHMIEEVGQPPRSGLTDAGWHFDRSTWLVRLNAEEKADKPEDLTIEVLFDATLRRKSAGACLGGQAAERVGQEPKAAEFSGLIRPASPPPNRGADDPGSMMSPIQAGALWEAELEIGLETGDPAKAFTALEQWWVERMESQSDTGEARVNLLVLYGLFVQVCNRQGWTLQTVLGGDYDAFRNVQALSGSEQAYGLMRGTVQRFVDYRRYSKKVDIHPLIKQVYDIVEKEPGGELSLQTLAERLHVNSSHLSRLFKREIGQPLNDYVLSRKMERAKTLLIAGGTVSETAALLGYKDTSHYIRVFRKYWGVTPGELKH
ncbi:TIM-barrel domain-containing protein [Paenibacillus ginsengarvi]|uniref:Helix-turn-helix domain-containing protein n=1 Tax=Paenibacillus ginsengarvi TaxID=400777 RepID=A0A3B0C451_9BACL|nr:TIM-barrel domain-containing protein [Paenibacillus ginsengarvi]RKN80532.1 helix-turn-helix domain-containing protein [Paenibacillus ginsengarvi]